MKKNNIKEARVSQYKFSRFGKGFTLIELLAVIVILAVIALIATPIILGIIDNTKKSAFQDTAYGIVEAAKNEYIKTLYKNETPADITYTYNNGVETSSIAGKSLSYSGAKPQNGFVSLNTEGKVSLKLHDGKYCVTKGYDDASIIVEEKSLEECMPPMVDQSGANAPTLTAGMTAIIWDEATSSWLEASDIDDPYKQNWYDYEDKKWANARTADGSMWVWIPRYAYQIVSGYHNSTAGTINIKFLQGTTNTTSDSIQIYEDSASNTHYVKHPAFTFGTTQLTGMWVAKFEMSGTTASLDSKPNVAALRNTALSNMFTASRNMETNNKYGWSLANGLNADGTFSTDTNNIDTHMMKNSEWGAVAYLSKSTYGNNAEIYINNSSTYITGCSGGSTAASSYSGCQYAYSTPQGQGASTTGNIYGIYDMSGGAYEYVMSNYNNTAGSSGLTLGSGGVASKYINIYSTTGSGYSASNYGDAVYETSSQTGGSYSWYGDYAYMISSSNPWFVRGGTYPSGSGAGAFTFYYYDGDAHINISWRSVVLVGTGL